MTDTIYWAVKLDMESVGRLMSYFPPVHPKVYAEHVTLVFSPTEEQDKEFASRCGEKVQVNVVGVSTDEKGQAVAVDNVSRPDNGIPHVTISCAENTKPVYSNILLSKGFEQINGPTLQGAITRFTPKGWDTDCAKLKEQIDENI